MNVTTLLVLLSASAALSLAACATVVAPGREESPVLRLADADPPPGFVRDRAVERALDDAQCRTGVGQAALHVLFAEAVIWHDSALGCPELGAPISEAMMPGFRIQAGAETLDDHAPRASGFLCPPGRTLSQRP